MSGNEVPFQEEEAFVLDTSDKNSQTTIVVNAMNYPKHLFDVTTSLSAICD